MKRFHFGVRDLLFLLLSALLSTALWAGHQPRGVPWMDVDGNPLPFQDEASILEFLTTAEIVEHDTVGEGINGIYKVVLREDGLRVHGAFRDVRVQKKRQRLQSGRIVLNFRDDCILELAAYRLGRLLGLDNIPPVVKREYRGKQGTLQIWVEKAQMEKDLLDRDEEPSVAARISKGFQLQNMHVFDNLINNDDRNLGNILLDEKGKVWMIDHTRSFRRYSKPLHLELVRYCRRDIYQALKNLDPKRVESELTGMLRPPEIVSLLKRREHILQHLDRLIAEKGEANVLF